MHDTHFEVSVCGRPSSIIRAASMFHWIHTQRARMGGGGKKRAFHCVHSNAGGKGGDGKRRFLSFERKKHDYNAGRKTRILIPYRD